MRTVLSLIAGCALFTFGCGSDQLPGDRQAECPERKLKPALPAQKAPLAPSKRKTEHRGYLETVVRQPQQVKAKLDLLGLKQSIEAYRALQGEYPKSLDDLKQEGLAVQPAPKGKAYHYDPKTGAVQVVDK